ncbi:uncharacterized protein LOC144537222 [Sander vitreus]
MERKKTNVASPSSSEYDAGRCKPAGDIPQVEEEFNEGRQTSISEKQMNADEKFSEDDVRVKLQSQSWCSISSSPLLSLEVTPTTTVHLDPDTKPFPYFLNPSQLELTPGNMSQNMYMSEDSSSSLNVPPSSFFHPSVVGQNSLPVYFDHEQPLDLSTRRTKDSNVPLILHPQPSQITSEKNNIFTGANSSPDMPLKQISGDLHSLKSSFMSLIRFRKRKLCEKDSLSIASTSDLPDYNVFQTSGSITETQMTKNAEGSTYIAPNLAAPVDQIQIPTNDPWVTACTERSRTKFQLSSEREPIGGSDAPMEKEAPVTDLFLSNLQYQTKSSEEHVCDEMIRLFETELPDMDSLSQYSVPNDCSGQNTPSFSVQYDDCRSPSLSIPFLHFMKGKYSDDEGPSFSNSDSTVSIQTCSLHPEMEAPVTAVNYSDTNTLPAHSQRQIFSSDPGCRRRDSSCLPRPPSMPPLSQITSEKNKTFTRSESLPDIPLKTSFEEFTPDITADETDETYRFQCSCPGLYQCSVTGLVFHMEGEGDVVYRIVPWNRRLLAQHHKKPAGPLFDIKCLQQSVCQLHLPHCEIRCTGGCDFLSVAHVNNEGIELISPHRITETHVIINITGFSGFGNVKDEDSPPDPVRALVLLFYRPPADPDPESLLNVLLLPRNVVLRDVQRIRKKLVGDERYIETSPHCKLHPQQEYSLSTCPEDDSVLVQPTEAEFDCDNYDNFFPSFQVSLETIMKHIKLFLRDTNSSHSVWERRVCLSSTGVRRSGGQSAVNLRPNDRLLDIRSSFIDGISGPVLKSLLDKLLEKKVMADSERESADSMQNRRDKARFVVDTVRKKGEAASSEMIEFLCEADPFLCEHLGLI